MPRKKLREVDMLIDSTVGLVVQLYFDPNRDRLDFVAQYKGVPYRADSLKALKNRVRDVVMNESVLTWRRIIVVEEAKDAVGFTADHFFIARRADGTYVRSRGDHRLYSKAGEYATDDESLRRSMEDWEAPDGRYRTELFTVPYTRRGAYGHTDTHYLPYDDETWRALIDTRRRLREVHETLSRILASPEAVLRLGVGDLRVLLPTPDCTIIGIDGAPYASQDARPAAPTDGDVMDEKTVDVADVADMTAAIDTVATPFGHDKGAR